MKKYPIHKIYLDKIHRTLNRMKELDKGNKIKEVYLFGSVARGTYTMESDIDLMIIMPDDMSKDTKRLLISELTDDIGYPEVDILVRSEETLSDKNCLFNELYNNDKILIWKEGRLIV